MFFFYPFWFCIVSLPIQRFKSQNRVKKPKFSIYVCMLASVHWSPRIIPQINHLKIQPPTKIHWYRPSQTHFTIFNVGKLLLFFGGLLPQETWHPPKSQINLSKIQGRPWDICFPPSSKWIAVKLDIRDICQIPFISYPPIHPK